jgi:hypothetical protein
MTRSSTSPLGLHEFGLNPAQSTIGTVDGVVSGSGNITGPGETFAAVANITGSGTCHHARCADAPGSAQWDARAHGRRAVFVRGFH